MKPKPRHLGPEYAAQFGDPSVVSAYRLRPPYPDETFEILLDLGAAAPRVVLDAGCGDGALARPLAPYVDRVDAVDPSGEMIAAGRRRRGGEDPAIRWIEATLEDAALSPPYDLVVAGQSLHWMEWSIALPRIHDLLAPGGVLAVISRWFGPQPWDEEVAGIVARFSTNREVEPFDLAEELRSRGLFRVEGRRRTAPCPWRQSLDEYVESHHSANGFSRDRMTGAAAAAFDTEVRALVSRHLESETVAGPYGAEVIWGAPLRG